MELIELIRKVEQENEDLNDHGDILTDSYQVFKDLIEGIKKHVEKES